jgi:hypothetical protein
MKTIELTGAALDWAVAQCEGFDNGDWLPDYSTDWAAGGPIIEQEGISIENAEGLYWTAGLTHRDEEYGGVKRAEEQGDTPLIAAMRCYVASKMGNEINLPEEVAK